MAIVFLGKARPPIDISTFLAQYTLATVYNLGFGGTRMSQHADYWTAFSMYQLATSIYDADFSIQDAAIIAGGVNLPSYFADTVTLLKGIDFNAVDIITISFGANDFTAGVTIENEVDLYDITTYNGATRTAIEKLLGAYPHLKNIIVYTFL